MKYLLVLFLLFDSHRKSTPECFLAYFNSCLLGGVGITAPFELFKNMSVP